MRVLIACEFSGTVREAFRKRGHEAYSCDLLPALDGSKNHYQIDVGFILKADWDLIIAHPPCTYLTTTGNKWFKPEYRERFPTREQDRRDAIEFFMSMINTPAERVAVENPIGIMSTTYRKPDQIIHPWMFGHEASKGTCLWLKNLPKLEPTNIVSKGEFVTFRSGKRMTKWYADAANHPPKERERIRNTTFQGIADAMAEQWG